MDALDKLIYWFNAFTDWLSGLADFIFDIPRMVRDAIQFVFWWFVHLVDYVFFTLAKPLIDWLESIDLPCVSCVNGLMGAIDYLLAVDWSSYFGFDVIGLMSYTMSFFSVPYGFEVVLCSITAKFFLRRIPGIG